MYTYGRSILQGDVSMNSRLFINGDVSMNSRLFIIGDVSMNARLFINGDVSMNGRLFLAGTTIGTVPIYNYIISSITLSTSSFGLTSTWQRNTVFPGTANWVTATGTISAGSGGLNITGCAISSTGAVSTVITSSSAYYSINYGSTWIQSTGISATAGLSCIAISSTTGQYQIAGGTTTGSTFLYVSNNYGQTWSQASGVPTSSAWVSLAISQDGVYQYATNSINLYISSNSGNAWTSSSAISGIKLIAVSGNNSGQAPVYQIAWTNANTLALSTNSGASFNTIPSVSIGGTGQNWKSIVISNTGQYMSLFSSTTNSYIYISSNYGSTWSTNGPQSSWNAGAMSDTGQYQVGLYGSGSTLYISTTYGITWASSGFTFNGLSMTSISIAGNGTYILSGQSGSTNPLFLSSTPYTNNYTASSVNSYTSYISNDFSMNSRLFVAYDVSYGGNMYAYGVSILRGDTTTNSRLFVSNDSTLNSRLFTLSDVSTNGTMYTLGRTIHQSDVSINSRLFVNGDVSMSSRLFVTSDVSMGARLFIKGDVSMSSRLFVTSDVSMGARLFVGNDVFINGRLNVFQYTNNNIIYTNVNTSNYTLIIAEDISLNGRLNVYYDASLSARLFVGSTQTSTSYNNGALTVAGGVGIGGNLFVNGTNNYINSKLGIATTLPVATLDIVTTYASTDTYSGGLVVRNSANSANQSSSIMASVGGTSAGNTYFATDILGSYGFSHGMTPLSNRYSFKNNYNFTGTEVMTLLTNGNIGIGITSPNNKLQISGGNNYTTLISTSVGSGTYGYGAVQQILSSTAIGTSAGAYTPLLQLASYNGNASYLNFYTYRNANGSDWLGTSSRIQQCIDYSAQAFIEFNSNTNNYGVGMYGNSGLGIVVSQSGVVNLNATSATHSISSTTASTSSITGAFTVAGGVGITGAVYTNSTLNTGGLATLNSLSVTNGTTLAGSLSVGNITTTGYMVFPSAPQTNAGINFNTGSVGITWGANYSRIFDDGDLRICTDDNIHFHRGSNTTNTSSGSMTESMMISSSGIVYIYSNTSSTSTTSGALQVTGGIASQGQINAASFNASSDYRIKENIKTLDETFTVDKLRPVHYHNKTINKEDIGIIAHELQENYPYLVNGEKDGESHQSVNYNGLIGILINEIQTMKKEMKRMQSEIDYLNHRRI
jgi:hypothetical protein